MSSALKKTGARMRKKEVIKVVHPPSFTTHIKSQMATPAPPLGPLLGQRGINVASFCQQFNKETSHIKPGIVIPTHITVNPDRTFAMELRTPLSTWFLKQAAGIRRGSERWLLFINRCTFFSSGGGRDIAGKVTLKHIYEIAKVKSRDRLLVGIPLQVICGMLIVTSRSVGIEVIRDSDTHTPEGYRAFLETRKQVVSDQLRALGERKAAKMLRTATPAASTTSSTTI